MPIPSPSTGTSTDPPAGVRCQTVRGRPVSVICDSDGPRSYRPHDALTRRRSTSGGTEKARPSDEAAIALPRTAAAVGPSPLSSRSRSMPGSSTSSGRSSTSSSRGASLGSSTGSSPIERRGTSFPSRYRSPGVTPNGSSSVAPSQGPSRSRSSMASSLARTSNPPAVAPGASTGWASTAIPDHLLDDGTRRPRHSDAERGVYGPHCSRARRWFSTRSRSNNSKRALGETVQRTPIFVP